MDILNFISWIKGGRVVTTVDPTQTLLPVGLKDSRRDDGYLAGAISVEDFANQVGGLQTVAVDGVTITGDGTPGDPLVAAGGSSYLVYTAVLTQVGASAPVPTVLQNTLGVVPTYVYTSTGQYTISGITPVLFSTAKVFIVAQGGNINAISNIVGGGPDAGKIQVLNYNNAGALANSGSNLIYLEIRVYP